MSDEIKILFYAENDLAQRALAGEITEFGIAAQVVCADDYEDFEDFAREGGFAALILDNPDENQRKAASELAKNAAVFFLTNESVEKSDATIIQKPFRLPVFLSVLMSAIGKFKQNGGAAVDLNGVLFDFAGKTLSKGDLKADLTDKEAAVLHRLLQSADGADKDALLKDVWEAADGVDTHTPETHLYRLRQKIEPLGVKITLTAQGKYTLSR